MAKNNRKFNDDVVIQLITGRMESYTDLSGKLQQEFIPSKVNKYGTLAQIRHNEPTLSEDALMVREGLRAPRLVINREQFQKSDFEKAELKKEKALWKLSLRSIA